MRFLLVACFVIVRALPIYAATTYVTITIDAETVENQSVGNFTLLEQFNAHIGAQNVGLNAMMDICEQNGFKATFFFDVYEYKRYGEEALRKIVQDIQTKGHDIQLHTHPAWAYDKKRQLLNQYSLEEQQEIIREGKKILELWTGTKVIAHRAGAYAADMNTITALSESGIYLDSSFFYSHPRCLLDEKVFAKNAVSQFQEVVELPVSIYRKSEFARFAGKELPGIDRIRKIDIDWAEYEDLRESLIQLKQHGIPVVNIFLHSFSLVQSWDSSGEQRVAAMQDIEKFQQILAFLKSSQDFKVVTFKELDVLMKKGEVPISPDFIPTIKREIPLSDYLRKRLGIHRGNVWIWIGSVAGLSFLLALSVMLYRRTRPKCLVTGNRNCT